MQEHTTPTISNLPATDNSRLFMVACLFFCALLFALIFVPEYLPMVDLPQHAAQITMWKQFDAGTLPNQNQYALKLFTPYLGGYTFARLLSIFMPVTLAIKSTVFIALILPPAALLWAIRNRPIQRWMIFLFIPFLFNWSFYWGFLNFIFAVGPTLFCIFLSIRLLENQSKYRFYLCALCAAVLFFFHIFCALMYVGLTWIYALCRMKKLQHLVFLMLAIIPFILLIMGWFHFRSIGIYVAQTAKPPAPTFWGLGIFRVINLPTTMLSGAYYGESISLFILIATALLIIASLYFGGCRKDRLLLLLMAALAYLLLPQYYLNCAYIYQRYSFLLIPLAVFCISDNLAESGWFPKFLKVCSVSIPTIYLASLLGVFIAFDNEVEDFTSFSSHMQKNKRVLSMMFDNKAGSVAGPVMLHFPLWYQAEQGGMVDFNFKSLVKHAPESELHRVSGNFVWNPRLYDHRTFDTYDYYIVKLPFELTDFPFQTTENQFDLLYREGDWYLFAPREEHDDSTLTSDSE